MDAPFRQGLPRKKVRCVTGFYRIIFYLRALEAVVERGHVALAGVLHRDVGVEVLGVLEGLLADVALVQGYSYDQLIGWVDLDLGSSPGWWPIL